MNIGRPQIFSLIFGIVGSLFTWIGLLYMNSNGKVHITRSKLSGLLAALAISVLAWSMHLSNRESNRDQEAEPVAREKAASNDQTASSSSHAALRYMPGIALIATGVLSIISVK